MINLNMKQTQYKRTIELDNWIVPLQMDMD